MTVASSKFPDGLILWNNTRTWSIDDNQHAYANAFYYNNTLIDSYSGQACRILAVAPLPSIDEQEVDVPRHL